MLHCTAFSAETPGDTKHATETAIFTLGSQQSFKCGSHFPCAPAPVCFTISLIHNYSLLHLVAVQHYSSALTQGTAASLYMFECVLCSSELCNLQFTKSE